MKSPEVPAAMMVFITIMFGAITSYATLAVQAFMNKDVINIISVPATRNEMF